MARARLSAYSKVRKAPVQPLSTALEAVSVLNGPTGIGGCAGSGGAAAFLLASACAVAFAASKAFRRAASSVRVFVIQNREYYVNWF